MKVLILYGTTEGQTRKIAQFIADHIIDKYSISLYDANDNPPPPYGFDVVIVCASLHTGRYQNAVAHYVKENATYLNSIKTAFVSVSLTAAGSDEEAWKDLNHIADTFLQNMLWKPAVVEQVAGALKYTEYDFFKKMVLKMIAQNAGGSTDTSKDTEYTDWSQLKRLIEKLTL